MISKFPVFLHQSVSNMSYKKHSIPPAALVAIERMNQLGQSQKPFFL
jgi:hypothetical protein